MSEQTVTGEPAKCRKCGEVLTCGIRAGAGAPVCGKPIIYGETWDPAYEGENEFPARCIPCAEEEGDFDYVFGCSDCAKGIDAVAAEAQAMYEVEAEVLRREGVPEEHLADEAMRRRRRFPRTWGQA